MSWCQIKGHVTQALCGKVTQALCRTHRPLCYGMYCGLLQLDLSSCDFHVLVFGMILSA